MKEKGQDSGVLDGATEAIQRGWDALRRRLAPSDEDAVGMLKAQHRHVETLFAGIEAAIEKSDRARAAELVGELDEALSVHAEIEEQHFYPAVRTAKTEELVAESFEEHRLMKQTLADVVAQARTGGGKELAAKVKVLKEQVVHHAKEEEEGKLFPLVRDLMEPEQLEALAQEMVGAMVEIEQKGGVPARPQPTMA